jgi:hypothetical protein
MKVRFASNENEECEASGENPNQSILIALTSNNVYRVIACSGDYYRIMRDDGEPYLYPMSMFDIVDESWPDDWVVELGSSGERYIDPKGMDVPGFREDYFDGDTRAIAMVKEWIVKQILGEDYVGGRAGGKRPHTTRVTSDRPE